MTTEKLKKYVGLPCNCWIGSTNYVNTEIKHEGGDVFSVDGETFEASEITKSKATRSWIEFEIK